MRRIWLDNVGVFEVIPNSGKGSCLFQAISQALTFSPKFHYKIRTSVVGHMTSDKWTSQLNQLPNFWKHKIIVQWLKKEKAHLMRRAVENRSRRTIGTRNLQLKSCCFYCMNKYFEKSREYKYHKIRKLVQLKGPRYCKDSEFISIFRKFMSERREPGTRFELEAAANHFRFHFDFLQLIPMTTTIKNGRDRDEDTHFCQDFEVLSITPNSPCSSHSKKQKKVGFLMELQTGDDTVGKKNNENEKVILLNQVTANPTENMEESKTVTVKMSTYEFHSCRKSSCEFPRGLEIEHFYFLHSPSQTSNKSRRRLYESRGQFPPGNYECGHWELLLPVSVRNPVPLNRRMFGVSYEIDNFTRSFATNGRGEQQETLDNVAKAIEAYVHRNPEIIPPENHDWPADDVDDYNGCAAPLRYMNCEDEKFNNNTWCSSNLREKNYVNPKISRELLSSRIRISNKFSLRDLWRRGKDALLRQSSSSKFNLLTTDTEDGISDYNQLDSLQNQ